ncbi:hypothetical protein PYCC9005_000232 [Savitreella phatthalungensis]
MHSEFDRNAKASLTASYNELISSFTALSVETVGNYALGKLVGSGAYGKCYLGRHKFLGSKVALKSTSKSEAANLAREIHHHRRLHHPNITQLYEVIVTESKVWLVLEYCSRGELYEHLIAQKRLSCNESARIFAQICGAVAYVHSRGVVHRDLKLENIFLDYKGNAKLGDFGFTRENDRALLETWCGSLLYASPEMIRGERYRGEAVDIWSLGVILYTLLAGSLPFDYDDDAMTKTAILEKEPQIPNHFTAEARDLLRLLLEKDSSKRPRAVEILSHPFLRDHAPEQFTALGDHYEPTFKTPMEQSLIDRLRDLGFDTERMQRSVIDYRCDALAGLWWLSIQRERRLERKYRSASARRSEQSHELEDSSNVPSRSYRSRSRSNSRAPETRFRGRHTPKRGSISSLAGLEGMLVPETVTEEEEAAAAEALAAAMRNRLRTNSIDTKSLLEHLRPHLRSKGKTLPEDAENKPVTDAGSSPANDRARQNGHIDDRRETSSLQRKGSIVQAFKTWWATQTKHGKEARQESRISGATLDRPTSPRAALTPSHSSDIKAPTALRPNSFYSPASSRRSSFTSSKIRTTTRPSTARRRSGIGPPALNVNTAVAGYQFVPERSGSQQSSNAAGPSTLRPDVLRSVSFSSNHSSVASISRGRTTHSKASSTSSASTFGESSVRSLRSPRHSSLKRMPATPPPFVISHNGKLKERNVFESTLAPIPSGTASPSTSNFSTNITGTAYASRKKRSSAVIRKDKPSRRRISMTEADLIEEPDEEEEQARRRRTSVIRPTSVHAIDEDDGFVDEETFTTYPGEEPPIVITTPGSAHTVPAGFARALQDLHEEQE